MKVGRNDPCPCGSHVKFKKCCLTQEKPKLTDYVINQKRAATINAVRKRTPSSALMALVLGVLGGSR